MKTTINLEELKALDPCDNGEAFEAVFKNKTVTFSEAAKEMKWEDIWWCGKALWNQLSKGQQDDIHLLGCEYAEEVLHIFEKKYPNDKRPRLAIEAKREWVRGEISDEELEEARSAAGSAVWSARSVWSAESAVESARSAESAAWSAESAAWSAAWSAAARSAAWSAAAGSARSAAWSAAESAESAAWVAETKAKQKDQLIALLKKWEESK